MKIEAVHVTCPKCHEAVFDGLTKCPKCGGEIAWPKPPAPEPPKVEKKK